MTRGWWTPERVAEVRARVAAGEAAREVAAALGTTIDAVTAVMRRNRIGSSQKGRGMQRPTPVPPTPKAPKSPTPDPVERFTTERKIAMLASQTKELIARAAEAEKRAQFWADLNASPIPPDIPRREFKSGIREGVAVCMLSDAHIEELVDPEKVAGRNAYNIEISERRMARFFDGAAWLTKFQREYWAVRDLILWLGGDLLTGFIHDELIETNELFPTEAILTLRRRIRSGINVLLQDDDLECITIPCSHGNHGRIGHRKRVKTGAENSFEWMLYNILADDYAGEPRVRFEVTRSAHQYVTAFDKTLHFTHGDSITYWGGVGGLTIPLNKRVPKWDNVKKANYHHIGHFHQLTDLGHTLVNGSVIGYSEYAFEIGADYEDPQQMFYLLDSKRGKCNVTPIWVSE